MDNNRFSEKETYANHDKKGVVPFSEVGKGKVKVRHISDQGIARCNSQNMVAALQANKRERQQSIEAVDQPRFGKVKALRKY